MENSNNIFVGLVGFVAVFGFVLLIMVLTRKLMLWYWKMDRVVELLEKIEQNTRGTKTEGERM